MNHSLGETILILIVYTLAVMRIVKLINSDTILDGARVAIHSRGQDEARSETERGRWNTFLEFSRCPWCVSVWVAGGTVWLPMWFADNPVVRYVALVLAVSMVVGLLARFSSDDDLAIVADTGV